MPFSFLSFESAKCYCVWEREKNVGSSGRHTETKQREIFDWLLGNWEREIKYVPTYDWNYWCSFIRDKKSAQSKSFFYRNLIVAKWDQLIVIDEYFSSFLSNQPRCIRKSPSKQPTNFSPSWWGKKSVPAVLWRDISANCRSVCACARASVFLHSIPDRFDTTRNKERQREREREREGERERGRNQRGSRQKKIF